MPEVYDLIVLGSGPAGQTAVYGARAKGWKTLVVEAGAFGGTCENRGCEPKKVLLGAAEILDRMRLLNGTGIFPSVRPSWQALMAFKRSFTDPVSANTRKGFLDVGADVLEGKAVFSGPNSIDVDGVRKEGRRILIATGASPAPLGVPGEALATWSDGFLDLDELPRRIVFVGGGYISMELAQVAALCGSEVTVIHSHPLPLKSFDAEVVSMAIKNLEDMGIRFLLDHPLISIERNGSLTVTAGKTEKIRVEADLVVHGAGRRPNLDLNLPSAGIERNAQGLILTPGLRTSNPSVWAAGDANGRGPALTPVAGRESEVALANMDAPTERKMDYESVPTVVFTLPSLAQVGTTESEARRRGLDFSVRRGQTESWYTNRRAAYRHTGFKTILEKESGRILGATLCGPGAEDVINLFALAVQFKLKADELKSMVWTFPGPSADVSYYL